MPGPFAATRPLCTPAPLWRANPLQLARSAPRIGAPSLHALASFAAGARRRADDSDGDDGADGQQQRRRSSASSAASLPRPSASLERMRAIASTDNAARLEALLRSPASYMQLELELERERMGQDSQFELAQSSLNDACARLGTTVPGMLRQHNLAELFPLLCHHYGIEQRANTRSLQDYFRVFEAQNQVLRLSRQLRDEIASDDHRYVAHCIVLLHMALHPFIAEMPEERAAIETLFERAKAHDADAAGERTMPAPLCAELDRLATRLHTAVERFDPRMLFRAAGALDVLRSLQSDLG